MTQPSENGTALVVRHGLPALYDPDQIDISREVALLNKMRSIRDTVLVKDVHYGSMPGVDRPFLQQPGAEVFYRVLNCRPRYDVVDSEVDRNESYCYFLVKAEVVSVDTGIVVGESNGACSSLEFDENCRAVYLPSQPDTTTVVCPDHGEQKARKFKAQGQWKAGCPVKSPQSLAKTLQNVQSRAQKRAMVAAIRTVGCISEMFTQDAELVTSQPGSLDNQPEGETPVQRPASKSGQGARARKQPPAPAAPAEGGLKPGNVSTNWAEEAKAGFATIVEAGVTAAELKGWAEDRGYLASGGKLTAGIIKKWAEANPEVNQVEGIPGFVNAVLTDLLDMSLEDVVEGEVVLSD